LYTPKQNNYYGTSFQAERGVQQGDMVSLTIFSIIIDSVIQASEEEMKNDDKTTIIFYTNDGFIAGFNRVVVQHTHAKFVKTSKALVIS
jgi:hypothetical protein